MTRRVVTEADDYDSAICYRRLTPLVERPFLDLLDLIERVEARRRRRRGGSRHIMDEWNQRIFDWCFPLLYRCCEEEP